MILAAVALPVVGYALYANAKVASRLSGDVVQYYLMSMAADLADRIDSVVAQRRLDAESLSMNWLLAGSLSGPEEEQSAFGEAIQPSLDGLVELTGVYDLILVIDRNGRFTSCNRVDRQGDPLDATVMAELRVHDYMGTPWFGETMSTGFATIDHHRSPLLPAAHPVPHPANYHVGFASRIDADGEDSGPVGVVLLLMNWESVQSQVSRYSSRHEALADSGNGRTRAVGVNIYKSSYAWIWKNDANTILAHPQRDLYEQQIDGPRVGLPQLVEAARASDWDMYPQYEFAGVAKSAAFHWCRRADEGGFGWVVGVGVDNEDLLAPVREMSRLLYAALAVALLLSSLGAAFMARRATRPILALERHTRRVAAGDLDTRIDVESSDEVGQLAASFNRMTAELKENRAQLVRAEKDAAWREMARQVAHEIKNPLTPISLSAGLLKRSKQENSPEFDAIFDRTIDLIQRQVLNMREIARDFFAFAGEHKKSEVVEVGSLLDEVLALSVAWAEQQGVSFHRAGDGGHVFADPDELKRAILNLVSNAIEAMEDGGGDLHATVRADDEEVTLEIRDTGKGLTPDALEHLFEPYFTTRSSGTGLGLAIVRRVIEDLGGRVELVNASSVTGRAGELGAIARIVLPAKRV